MHLIISPYIQKQKGKKLTLILLSLILVTSIIGTATVLADSKDSCNSAKGTSWSIIAIMPVSFFIGMFVLMSNSNLGASQIVNFVVSTVTGLVGLGIAIVAFGGISSAIDCSVPTASATLPDPPFDVNAIAVSSTEIDITWSPNTQEITGYAVERGNADGTSWTYLTTNTHSTGITYNDTGLTPATTYQYHIYAINDNGKTVNDDIGIATTWGAPDPPTGLSAVATSPTTVNLSWATPTNNGGTSIIGYKVQRQNACTGSFNVISSNTGNASTIYTDSGLTANTCYNYTVASINTVGTGSTSSTANATTHSPFQPPPPPTNLKENTKSTSQIDLLWTAPTGVVTGYKIEQESPVGNGFGTINANTGNSTTKYSIIGLANATQYNFRVSAINATGTSSPSSQKSNYTASDPPYSLLATAKSKSQIDLTWGSSGGAPVTVMKDTTASSGLITDAVRPIQAEFVTPSSVLVNQQIDTIQIQIKKQGLPTGTVTVGIFYTNQTTKKIFGTIDSSTVSTSYTNYQFNLGSLYTIVANDRIGFKYAGGDSSNDIAVMRDTTNGFDSTNSYHTYYQSGWTNSTGNDLTMTLSSGSSSGATSFKIERESPVGGGFSTIVADTGDTTTSYSNTGLTQGTQYNYRVSTINHGVLSLPSTSSAATTWTVTTAPVNLGATAISQTQIDLSWSQPASNGGTPVTGYKIQRQNACTGAFVTVVNNTGTTTTTYSNTGLTANTCYIYKVSSYNLIGQSAVSNNATATTPASSPQPPSSPTNLSAVGLTNSTIHLAWTAPTGVVTGYKVERSTGGSGFGTIAANTGNTTTKYNDTGLASATTYSYRVSAINATGTSSPSNTADGTTTGSPTIDKFGITMINPTISGGKTWYSTWDNGITRTFGYAKDPQDPWFDAAHGSATFTTIGDGILKISGSTPRMYVHDPALVSQWRDIEVTMYFMRVADSNVAWSGMEAVGRSNHGTTLQPETVQICDTRGIDARMRDDGHIDFEKETKHPYSSTSHNKNYWGSGGLPKNVWIGYKLIEYDLVNGSVKLQMWIDNSQGVNGGSWVKLNEMVDNGNNFGVGGTSCNTGIFPAVDPAQKLTNAADRYGSESHKPNITTYFRADSIGTNGLLYKWGSIREITGIS